MFCLIKATDLNFRKNWNLVLFAFYLPMKKIAGSYLHMFVTCSPKIPPLTLKIRHKVEMNTSSWS